MRAIAAVVQPVATKDRVVRHVDIQGVAHKTDVVVEDARALGVVELDAIAALRRPVLALAGDGVVLDEDIVRLLDPQPEQVVSEIAAAHDGTVGPGVEVDPGVLVLEAVARIAHDQALDHHIG